MEHAAIDFHTRIVLGSHGTSRHDAGLVQGGRTPDWDLLVLLSGKATLEMGGEMAHLLPGHGLLLWPGDESTLRVLKASRLFWLHFALGGSDGRPFRPRDNPPGSRAVFTSPDLPSIVNRFREKLPGSSLDLEHALWHLVAPFIMAGGRNTPLVPVKTEPLGAMVDRWIRLEPDGDITLTRLGEVTGLHPHWLSTRFKSETGKPFRDFVRERKMEHGKALVRDGLPLHEIALRLGYADGFAFSKAYKRAYGKSPRG